MLSTQYGYSWDYKYSPLLFIFIYRVLVVHLNMVKLSCQPIDCSFLFEMLYDDMPSLSLYCHDFTDYFLITFEKLVFIMHNGKTLEKIEKISPMPNKNLSFLERKYVVVQFPLSILLPLKIWPILLSFLIP